MRYHKHAEYFPLLEGDEFEELVQDIAANGLRESIVTLEGKILDGRNRYRACLETEKRADLKSRKPRFKQHLTNNPLEYVMSMNLRRRHLNPSQRAIIGLDLLPVFEKEAEKRNPVKVGKTAAVGAAAHTEKGRAAEKVGKLVGVHSSTLRRAKRISQEAPHRVPDIRAGRVTVNYVEQQIIEAKARKWTEKQRKRDALIKRRTEDREVKIYLDALSDFKAAAKEARAVAEYGKFSPEAGRFVIKRHKELRELMTCVEGEFDVK